MEDCLKVTSFLLEMVWKAKKMGEDFLDCLPLTSSAHPPPPISCSSILDVLLKKLDSTLKDLQKLISAILPMNSKGSAAASFTRFHVFHDSTVPVYCSIHPLPQNYAPELKISFKVSSPHGCEDHFEKVK